jgi:hypothetical protein
MRIMKIRFALLIAVAFAATAVAQSRQTITTRALEPAAEDLARLNLVTAWRIYLPVENRGDTIATVQPFDDQVLVQLQSGRVIAIQAHADPKTYRRPGDILWTYRALQRPGAIRPLAVGATEVYVVHGQKLLILDRTDGKVKYTEDLSSTGGGGLIADAEMIYIPLDNRKLVAYSHVEKIPGYRPPKPYEAPDHVSKINLAPQPADPLSTPQNRSPSIGLLEVVRPPFYRSVDTIDSHVSIGMLRNLLPPYREVNASRSPSVALLPNLRDVYQLSDKESVTRVKFEWELLAPGQLIDTPVLTSDPTDPTSEMISTSTGRSLITAKRAAERTNSILTEYFTEAEITAPLTNRGDSMYVATADSNFVSLSVTELREPSMAVNSLPRGKFTSGGPVEQKPLLTDSAIYIVGERWGLMRLKHTTLEPLWQERLSDGRLRPKPNSDVVRVLSTNSSYVYGLDRRGRLLVIDALRGSTLSTFDVSAFSVPVTNEVTDRVYLASNSGFLVCLHDKQRVRPEYLRKPPAPKKAEAPPPEKEPEKKDPENK